MGSGMSRESVAKTVRDRLEQDERGDRGWFIITRVHVEAFRIKGIAEYIFHKAEDRPVRLNELDYSKLSQVAGVASDDPGVQLRRHHLLVMYKPLLLIERTDPSSWDEIKLTSNGVALATSSFYSEVLENSLEAITFAKRPAIPNDRIKAYAQFDIKVMSATRQVLQRCEGYVTRDEFDYFLSRVRTPDEVNWAIDGILDFRDTQRQLTATQNKQLLAELSDLVRRGLSAKQYQNWRDVALHTFSLFGLGTSMVRRNQVLWLTDFTLQASLEDSPQEHAEVSATDNADEPAPVPTIGTDIEAGQKRKKKVLKLPSPPENDDLLQPPVPPDTNSGAEAEDLIAKLLRADGWKVVFYSDKRGYGFDIWATKGRLAMVIEVKSSLSRLDDISLTQTELDAARAHAENFVIAIVENCRSGTPTVWFISDPASKLEITESNLIAHRINRSSWTSAATPTIS